MQKYLTTDQLDALAENIRRAEESTRGEIRVSILRKRGWLERKLTPEQLALKEFRRLKMHRTTDRTGILLLVLLEERAFHILADEGIHSKVTGDPWQAIASDLTRNFKDGKYETGLSNAIAEMGRILREHVPQHPGDTNELSNTVAIR
jgi:uncharacterized membrane protein